MKQVSQYGKRLWSRGKVLRPLDPDYEEEEEAVKSNKNQGAQHDDCRTAAQVWLSSLVLKLGDSVNHLHRKLWGFLPMLCKSFPNTLIHTNV